ARALSNKTTAYEASVAKQVAQIDASKLRTSEITLATSAATAALSGYGLENVVEGMFSKGASTKGILESAGAFVGLALSMHVMSTALKNTVGMLSGGKPITFLQKFFLGTDPKTPAILAKYLGPTLSHGLGRALSFLTSGPGILAITGLIVLLSWLMSRKSPEEQGAETLNDEVAPSVW